MYWRKCGHCEHCIYDSDINCNMCELKKIPVKLPDSACEYFKEDDPNV